MTAGYDTVAVTRQPGAFVVQDPRLRVAGADVLDADAMDGVVEGSDAVLSALGVPFGKRPSSARSRTTVSSAGSATSP
jgi:putative NADH-flavin reductase